MNTTQRITVVLLIITILYALYLHHQNTDNCITFLPHTKEEVIEKITHKELTPPSEKLLISCRNGMIKGSVIGFLTNGIEGAITMACIHGLTNGWAKYHNIE